jgi:hypothetical protein
VSQVQCIAGPAIDSNRLLYGLSFPMSEEAQKDDFVIPVSL